MENKKYYNNFIYDWWKNIDKVILFLFITLIILGIFFSLVSTSLIASSKFGTNNYYFFLRHLHFRYNIAYCLVASSGERGRLLQYIALLPIYADIVADSREAPRHRKSRLIHD